MNRRLGRIFEAEDLAELEEVPEDKPTKLISLPSSVKSIILVPKVKRVVFIPKKALDIRRKVARVVHAEIERLRGRV